MNAPIAENPPRVELTRAREIAHLPLVPELAQPYLDGGEDQLTRRLAALGLEVRPSVERSLVDWLGQKFARLANLVIAQRYASYRLALDPLWRPGLARVGAAHEDAPRAWLDAYINWERGERLLELDGPYPELGRLLAEAQEQWLEACIELLERVRLHQDSLAELLGVPGGVPQLERTEFGISDPHMGGRSAAILHFREGRVVYKPRPLPAEELWHEMVSELESQALGLDAYDLRFVHGPDYGFMSFVEQRACDGEEQLVECFTRYGVLLALGHALGSCDLHHENVIVDGVHPVVIDSEAILRPRLRTSASGETRTRFDRELADEDLLARPSLLELGVLPGYMPAPPTEAGGDPGGEHEYGAMCAYAKDPIGDILACGCGSDDLQMRGVELFAEAFPSLPRTSSAAVEPGAYVDSVLRGFHHSCDYLRGARDDWAKPGAYLERLDDLPVRGIFRPTMDYANVLSRSLAPETLRSRERRKAGIERDLEVLSRMRFDVIGELAAEELSQIMAGDVPRFEVLGGEADDRLAQAPASDARQRLAGLDEVDEALQAAAIRERLQHRELVRRWDDAAHSSTPAEVIRQRTGLLADAIANALDLDARRPSWVFASFVSGLGSTMTHIDPEALYDGSGGTALALSAAGVALGRPELCERAARLFRPLLEGAAPVSAKRTGGLARGLGGVIYALTRVGRDLRSKELLDLAARYAVEHGRRLAVEDELDELLYGRAGLLLALLALERVHPDAGVAAVADLAAEELIRRARRDQRGVWWERSDGPSIAHVSHGGAGIALALARWADRRSHQEGLAMAREAIRLDERSWRPELSGWIDERLPAGDEQTSWTWCNGRLGAMLARVELAELTGSAEPCAHLDAALRAEDTDIMLSPTPGLCCGSAGALDVLLELQTKGGLSDLEGRRAQVERLLLEATPKSQLSTLTGTLFTGTGGLLFALARALDPEGVDSVLGFR